MGILDWLKGGDPELRAAREAAAQRQLDIQAALRVNQVPALVKKRLEGVRDGQLPWTATMTPAELLIARSHGIRPLASIAATCWMHYGYSWTEGHSQGWEAALRRMRLEAKAVGANAVVDVKMRTVSVDVENSMDFTLVGTAVKIDGLPPSGEPVIATVPALEFVKLLEADVVPTGIAVGAHFQWMTDWNRATALTWAGNVECRPLSTLWETVRQRAHVMLRLTAHTKGNGVLAHVNFSEMFEGEANERKQYLARHIVVATTVDAKKERIARDAIDAPANDAHHLARVGQFRSPPVPHEFRMVVDLHADSTPLVGTKQHHSSYRTNDIEVVGEDDNDDNEGAI